MFKIYVANCTKQNLSLNFRRKEKMEGGSEYNPNDKRYEIIDVPSGCQSIIDTCKSKDSIDSLIYFFEKSYGFKKLGDVSISKNFSGYIYSTEKPIASDIIECSHEKVVERQEEVSLKAVNSTALSLDKKLNVNGKRPKISEVEVIEDNKPFERESKRKKVNFKISVEEGGTDNVVI